MSEESSEKARINRINLSFALNKIFKEERFDDIESIFNLCIEQNVNVHEMVRGSLFHFDPEQITKFLNMLYTRFKYNPSTDEKNLVISYFINSGGLLPVLYI